MHRLWSAGGIAWAPTPTAVLPAAAAETPKHGGTLTCLIPADAAQSIARDDVAITGPGATVTDRG